MAYSVWFMSLVENKCLFTLSSASPATFQKRTNSVLIQPDKLHPNDSGIQYGVDEPVQR